MKKLLNKLAWKLVKKTCDHKNKHHVFTCYQDRYYKYYCPDCKTKLYEEML